MADERTIRYYEENAEAVYDRYRSGTRSCERYFRTAFREGSKVLDIGAGSGRDLESLIRSGYDAWGIEPTRRLREIAIARCPGLAGRLREGMLPGIPPDLMGQFGGVLCSAVFMHVPETDHASAAAEIRGLLMPGGRLLVAIPSRRDDVGADHRDSSGRLFTPITPERLQLLLASVGFRPVGRWDDDDPHGRAGIAWATLLFEC